MLPLQIYTLNTLSMSHLDDRCNGGLMVGKFNQPLTNNRRKIKVKHEWRAETKNVYHVSNKKTKCSKRTPPKLTDFCVLAPLQESGWTTNGSKGSVVFWSRLSFFRKAVFDEKNETPLHNVVKWIHEL